MLKHLKWRQPPLLPQLLLLVYLLTAGKVLAKPSSPLSQEHITQTLQDQQSSTERLAPEQLQQQHPQQEQYQEQQLQLQQLPLEQQKQLQQQHLQQEQYQEQQLQLQQLPLEQQKQLQQQHLQQEQYQEQQLQLQQLPLEQQKQLQQQHLQQEQYQEQQLQLQQLPLEQQKQLQQQHLQQEQYQEQQLQLHQLPLKQQEQLQQQPPELLQVQTLTSEQLHQQQSQPLPLQQFPQPVPLEELQQQRLQAQPLHLPPEQVHNQQLQLQQLPPEQQQRQPLQTPQQPPPFSPNLDGEKFRYSYSVQDPASGGRSGHLETRNGVFSLGNYFVKMPGSTQQTVNYFTDDWGYHPVVAYSTASGSAVTSTHFALGGRAVAALQHQHKLHHRMPKHRQFKEEPIPSTVLVAPAAPLPPPPATLVAPAAPISLSQVNPLLLNSELPDIGENSLTSLSPPPIPVTTPSAEPEVSHTSSVTASSPGVSDSDGNIIDEPALSGSPSTIRPIIVAETGVTATDEISTVPTTPSTLTTVTSDGTDSATSPTVVITPRPPATTPSPQGAATETFGAASYLTSVSAAPEQHLEQSNHNDDYKTVRSSNNSSKEVEKMTEMIIEKSPAVFEAHYHTTVEILKSIPLDAETGKIQTSVEEQERHYSTDSVHFKNLQQAQQLQEHAHSQLLKHRAKEQAEFERRLEEEIKDKKAQIDQLYQEIDSQQNVNLENTTEGNTGRFQESKLDEHREGVEPNQGQSAHEQIPLQPTGESNFGNRIRPLRLNTNSPFTLKLRPVNDALLRPPEVSAYTLLPIVQLQHQPGITVPSQDSGIRLEHLRDIPSEYSFRQQIEDPEFQKQLGRLIRAQELSEDGQRNGNQFEVLNQRQRSEFEGARLQGEDQRADSLKHTNSGQPLLYQYHLDLLPPPQEISTTQIKQPSSTEQILQELQTGRIQQALLPGGDIPGQFHGISLQLPQQMPLREVKQQDNRLVAEAEQATQQQSDVRQVQTHQLQTNQNEEQQQQAQTEHHHQQELQAETQQRLEADSIRHSVQFQDVQSVLQTQEIPVETLAPAEDSPKEEPRPVQNQQEISQIQYFLKDNREAQEPITALPLHRQIGEEYQQQPQDTRQHEIDLREQQIQSELQPSSQINLEDLQQQRLETEQTRQSSYEAELIQDRAQTTDDNTENSHRHLDSDQQQIQPSPDHIAQETDNHPKSEDLYQQTFGEESQSHHVESEPQVNQAQLSIVQFQQVPAGTEQLQTLADEHLNAPQHIPQEEHQVQAAPGDTNLLQPPAPPIVVSVEIEKHQPFPPPPVPIHHNVAPAVQHHHPRHPPPRPTTASYAAQVQRHRETDLSHKAVPGIDFDKQVHCAERVYSYEPNGGAHPWNRNTRRANLRKLCIEYGGFKPPLVPSTPIEEDGQPVGPPPPLVSSHHNAD